MLNSPNSKVKFLQSTMFNMETNDPFSPSINSLPDELLLRIIQNTACKRAGYFGQKRLVNHRYLIDVISKISKRFKNIAGDNVFWKNEVSISLDEELDREMKRVVDCMGQNVQKLQFYDPQKFIHSYTTSTDISISSGEIIALAKKATDLRRLELCGLKLVSWPMLPSTWSLEDLVLRDVNIPWDMFQNVAIHHCLPNLKTLKMIRCMDDSGTPIMLPDMSGCQQLEEVRITGMDNDAGYRFSTNLPFPKGIKKLVFLNVIFDGISSDEFDQRVKGPIEKFARNCKVESF